MPKTLEVQLEFRIQLATKGLPSKSIGSTDEVAVDDALDLIPPFANLLLKRLLPMATPRDLRHNKLCDETLSSPSLKGVLAGDANANPLMVLWVLFQPREHEAPDH